MSYTRFAIYYVPPHDSALADFGAAWLGWDVRDGTHSSMFTLDGLDDTTMTPRKYGFHGTLKPPFRLKEGTTRAELEQAILEMSKGLAPAVCDGLQVQSIGRFLALAPVGDFSEIRRVAQGCVSELDDFRAPASAAELTRRRAAGLTPTQEGYLLKWGYPYVFEEFYFHLTLSGKLPPETIEDWRNAALAHMPQLETPFTLDEVALVGEREDGHFEVIQRYPLLG